MSKLWTRNTCQKMSDFQVISPPWNASVSFKTLI